MTQIDPQNFAQITAQPELTPEVQLLASVLRVIEVPSRGAMPPIRFEFPEPTRVAESLYAKGVRVIDTNALDPAGRITEIVSALHTEDCRLADAREIVALILRGFTATQAVDQVIKSGGVDGPQLAHQTTENPSAGIASPGDHDQGPVPLPDQG
ncbi:hypothetical protein [Nocardia brasiliensis]|uniref:hypothetical protein n=1 Tax=Nocardia brasiliensis TaxID=37326 RepID=UPI0024568C2F|nr:hypothetical protein [Nocardia brasiliensis]